MTSCRQNKKKRICKQLLTVGILLLFTIATAGISLAQSLNAGSDQSPNFAVGKLKKENNWQLLLGNLQYKIPANARIFGCDKEETELSTNMNGEQAKVIFRKIETPEGEIVKKVDKVYLICK